jgi:hypothetical protein
VLRCQAASRKFSRRALGNRRWRFLRYASAPDLTRPAPIVPRYPPKSSRKFCALASSAPSQVASPPMEQANPKSSRKAIFVLAWAIVWGGCMALALIFSDRHRTGHFDTPFHLAVRFSIFLIGGIFMGLYTWKLLQAPRKQFSPTVTRLRTVLFFSLMLGLAYAIWRMWNGN